MPVINTYLGDNVNWVASKNGSNGFNLTFTNGGVAFDISTYTFVLNISRPGHSTNALQLTQASGLTNGGATGILQIVLTEAQASTTLPRDLYFYQLIYTKDSLDYAMIQGNLTLSATANPGDTTSTLTVPVSLVGTPVNVEVSLAGDVDLAGEAAARAAADAVLQTDINTRISKAGDSTQPGEDQVDTRVILNIHPDSTFSVESSSGITRFRITQTGYGFRTNNFELLFDGDNVTFEDLGTPKKGIQYSASGYVTQAQSLADREYVDNFDEGEV